MIPKNRGPYRARPTPGAHQLSIVIACLWLGACGDGDGSPKSDNEVVATLSPAGTAAVYVGKSRDITATFTTTDDRSARALNITSGLTALPAGWTSPSSSFGCAIVGGGSTCALTLTYAPTTPGNGTLTLEFSYDANDGTRKTGSAAIDYSSASPLLKMVAGSVGGSGTLAGTGTTARFDSPTGLHVDHNGTLLVAEVNANTIRRISPAFDVTTLAGSPPLPYANPCGSSDGTGTAARFCRPTDVAIDGAGMAYVVDALNSVVRRITHDGVVTTLAGTPGQLGWNDGIGAAAGFYWPEGIAVDAEGTPYVADTGNCAVRKVSSTGVVTTYAGRLRACGLNDGPRDVATLGYIRGIAIDDSGAIYVTDRFRHSIRRISPDGAVTTIAGVADVAGSVDGSGTAARFNYPYGIAVDGEGNVFVADRGNATIRKITASGVVSTLAGVAGQREQLDGTGAAARFREPKGLAIGRGNILYISDEVTIRRITPDGVVTTVAGEAGLPGTNDGIGSAARFSEPHGVAVAASGKTFVADTLNHTIRAIAPDGPVTTLAGSGGVAGYAEGSGPVALFKTPQSVAADGDGVVYAADSGNHTIRRISSAGSVTVLAGMPEAPGAADGAGALALFNSPHAIVRDATGNLYVADTLNHIIRKVTRDGVVTTLAGTAGQIGSADGAGPAARFNAPQGIGIDGGGAVYVADTGNNTIRRVSSQGMVTTLAGTAAGCGFKDGSAAEARFCVPRGLVVDGAGNVLVADMSNHVIRRITSNGTVATVIGNPSQKGIRVGPPPWFLSAPTGIALRPDGELVITDGHAVLVTEGF